MLCRLLDETLLLFEDSYVTILRLRVVAVLDGGRAIGRPLLPSRVEAAPTLPALQALDTQQLTLPSAQRRDRSFGNHCVYVLMQSCMVDIDVWWSRQHPRGESRRLNPNPNPNPNHLIGKNKDSTKRDDIMEPKTQLICGQANMRIILDFVFALHVSSFSLWQFFFGIEPFMFALEEQHLRVGISRNTQDRSIRSRVAQTSFRQSASAQSFHITSSHHSDRPVNRW